MNCTICGSRIVSYKGENLCLKCPTVIKQVYDQHTYIEYYKNTNIVMFKSWKNKKGEYHRDSDKPAYISYYENGNIHIESYYINDKFHRDNAKPAYIRYDENGNIFVEGYWINGVKVK